MNISRRRRRRIAAVVSLAVALAATSSRPLHTRASAAVQPERQATGFLPGENSSSQTSASTPRADDSCAVCHRGNNDEVIGLYQRSVHFRRSISCNHCHGGNPVASGKTEAHSGSFVGRPEPSQVLTMCGSCHTSQLAVFKKSHHYNSSKAVPRVDCAQCHGAHTVGGQASTFSMSYFCAGCHGLEYLPTLPAELRGILEQSDKIRDAIRSLEQSGKKPSDEAVALRRELRRTTGDIVHTTDLDLGAAKIPEIKKLAESLLTILDYDKATTPRRE